MHNLTQFFNISESLFIPAIFFISMIIGSFLNVIILRLPNTLQKEWSKQCYIFLKDQMLLKESITFDKNNFFDLFVKSSHCPHCKNFIKLYDNIPLLSYLLLRGKCRACQQHISLQYPTIEFLTAIFASLVAFNFGVTWQALAGCVFTYVLIVQSTIDLHHTIIPDEITLPMIWIGLIISIFGVFVDSHTAIIGAIAGYLLLWIIYWVFYLLTKKEGMGYGDFKLLAMLGAWLGWQMIPFIILFSSILGSIVGVTIMLTKHGKHRRLIPFGPFLAIAGWVALMWGPTINIWYINYAGL